jgi:membrane-bound lytic murein transglycosylase D
VPVAAVGGAVRTQHYTVRKGDTLVTVADHFNVSVAELRSWNHLQSSTMKTGQVLNVEAPVRLAPLTHARAKKANGATVSTTAKGGKAKPAPAVKSAATSTAKTGMGNSSTKNAPTVNKK